MKPILVIKLTGHPALEEINSIRDHLLGLVKDAANVIILTGSTHPSCHILSGRKQKLNRKNINRLLNL